VSSESNRLVSGFHLGTRLCDALGLKDVRSLSLSLELDGLAELTVVQLMRGDASDEMVEVIKRYNLVDADDEG
jgi:hypothetical protein